MGATGADRGADRSTANDYAVTARDDPAQYFARLGIDLERRVIEPLPSLKTPYWLGEVGSFVNVGRHND
jgi:hypothetical protein